ncbi:hypothetical protein [Comamonas sp. GB3 AK4-5]|uniref:hypothetical protein n=1 Tax=Comamonas sp. GB3 AK4-5 TaxID=3231487 RepID=UPI00351DBAA4
MNYDIQGKIAETKLAYEAALVKLEAARSTYDQGPKAELASALEQQEKMVAKIATCRANAKAAEAEFKQAFEAAGYERTTAVRQALNRKNDAVAMAEELEIAQGNVRNHLDSLLLDASPKAATLRSAYRSTKEAYGRWKAYDAMGESAGALKGAIALAAYTIPHSSDSLGRLAFSSSDAQEELRRSLAFIWDGLLQMAFEGQEQPALPFAQADISPLKTSDLLTPCQAHIARRKAQTAAD